MGILSRGPLIFKMIIRFFHLLFRYVALRNFWLARKCYAADYKNNIQMLGSLQQSGAQSSPPHTRRFIPSVPGAPRRLAYVSPLPPDHSGIAKYSTDLLPALSRHFDLVLIHPTLQQLELKGVPTQVHTPEWLLKNHSQFDLVLYHIGNSPFHTYMLELMEQVPGTVVLHDVFITHLLAHEYHAKGNLSLYCQHLFTSHGLQALGHNSNISDIFNFPGSGRVLQHAEHVYVYSNHARELIGRFYGKRAQAKTTVLNMPIARAPIHNLQVNREKARAELGLSDSDTLVCCFGLLQSSKCSASVLDAWLALQWCNHPDKQLVFVGGFSTGDPYAQNMLQKIESLGPSRQIKVLGWVDDSVYQRYLLASNLAVQLRTGSRGETSAALLNTLAHGVPTLINRHGSMAEVPEHVVHQLPDNFTPAELEAALQKLVNDPVYRSRLRQDALTYVAQKHDLQIQIDVFKGHLQQQANHRHLSNVRPMVWIDFSFVFLFADSSPSFFESSMQYLKTAMNSDGLDVDLLPSVYNPYLEQFVFIPEALDLPQGTVAQHFLTGLVRTNMPDLLLVDPRIRGLAYKAIRSARQAGTQVRFAKPQQSSTELKLSDQLIRGMPADPTA